jgi:uncharacterized protein (DUF488 family)
MARRLLTVGHGAASQDAFVELLREAGVRRLVDVRRFPGSRRHPHVARDRLAEWLPAAGVDYRWEEALGGRRRPALDSPHVALRDESFRGYADHMATAPFLEALDALLADADAEPTACLCAESLWWRCHRRLIADAAVLLRGAEVLHLLHDGRLVPHVPTEGVRRDGGLLVYDGGQARLEGVEPAPARALHSAPAAPAPPDRPPT